MIKHRHFLATALFVAVVSGQRLGAQSDAFEVASVKRSRPVQYGESVYSGLHPTVGGLRGIRVSLQHMIGWAYGVRPERILGPAWMESETYDVDAKTQGKTTVDQVRLMLRALLKQRFHLAVHSENKPATDYELTVGRRGLTLEPATVTVNYSTSFTSTSRGVSGYVSFESLTNELSRLLNYVVVDNTGDKGVYKMALTWRREDAPDDDGGATPSIFQALRSLGLELRAVKSDSPFIIIDRVDREPVAN